MLIGASYARVSDDEEEQSLQEQVHINLHHMQTLGVSKNFEWKIEYTLIEKAGLSGGNAKRPRYQELLILIKNKKIDFIVCKEVSRLSRSMDDFTTFLSLTKKYGVKLFIRGLDVDLNSPMGELLIMFLGSLAQAERSMIKERTTSSIRSLARTKGKIHGRNMLYGFERDKDIVGRWHAIENEISNVAIIMSKFNELRCFNQLVIFLKNEKIFNKNDKIFTKDTLERMLQNPIYIGKIAIPGSDNELVEIPSGSQIPESLFNSVQKTINEIRTKFSKNTRNVNRIYPLSGLLYSIDNSKFSGKSGTGRNGVKSFHYRCEKADLTYDCLEFENSILLFLEDLISNSGIERFRIDLKKQTDTLKIEQEKKLSNYLTRIKVIDSMLNKSIDILLNSNELGTDLTQMINERTVSLKDEKLQILQNLQETKKSLEELVNTNMATLTLEDFLNSNLSVLKDSENLATMRGFFRKIFNKIIVDPSTKQINIFWNIEATDHAIILPTKQKLSCISRNKKLLEKFELLGDIEASLLYKYSVLEQRSADSIALELNVARSTVLKYQKIYGIKSRPTGTNISRKRGVPYTKKFLSNGQIININSEIEIEKGIKRWRTEGLTYEKIAKTLNDEKIPTKTKRGLWHRKTVHQIINRKKEGG